MEQTLLNTFTTASVVIIALAALFVAVWQVVTTRKHNRLSVKPLLRIDKTITLGKPVCITVTNKGVGPAIIKEFKVFLDRKEAIGDREKSPVEEIIRRMGFQDEPVNTWTPKIGDPMSSGDIYYLIKFLDNESVMRRKEMLESAFRHITFRIVYESIYGEKFLLDEKKE